MSHTFDQQHHRDIGQTVVVDIDQYLHEGMPVYDKDGDYVGKVKLFSTAAGYLLVREQPTDKTFLYIPFRIIQSADPNEIYLSESIDTMAARYTQPPAVSTISETRLVPGPLGNMTPQTYHVQIVQSGYDAQQVELNAVDADKVGQQLAVGMSVYDVAGKRVGDLTQYDIPRALLVVEKGIFNPTVLFVPFSAVKRVDTASLSVDLSLPTDALVKEHALLPAEQQ